MVQKKSKKSDSNDSENIIEPCSASNDGSACHWVIDPPNGPVSSGKCKKCGKSKEFKNSVEFSSWYGSKSDFDQDKKKKKSK
tara:strand:+ start:1842 stop:2087 length:246 start_codon:yes stop_codon:yes gene_type:complete